MEDFDLFVSNAKAVHLANRLEEVERRDEGATAQGDFKGSVTGFWQKLDKYGAGIVLYKGKLYSTKSIGFLSLPKGTEVELSFANGIYYSKF